MTKEDILTCVIQDLERTKRVDEELIAEAVKNHENYDYYYIGYCQGRINLCEDLIRFINNNLEVKK